MKKKYIIGKMYFNNLEMAEIMAQEISDKTRTNIYFDGDNNRIVLEFITWYRTELSHKFFSFICKKAVHLCNKMTIKKIPEECLT